MFEYRNLTKNEFLARNLTTIEEMISQTNTQLSAENGPRLQPLTPLDFWLVFQAEAAIDRHGHVDPDGQHSLGERGILPLPSNVEFWNGPGAPDPHRPHPMELNLHQYALYLGQLKNKVVRQRNGRDVYPDLFRHPGIEGHPARMAKLLAGVVHGYFFGGNYRPGPPPDNALLSGYASDRTVPDMLRGTTYVHAGSTILENRQRNIDEALAHFGAHNPDGAALPGSFEVTNDDGRYILAPEDASSFGSAQLRLDVDGPQSLRYLSLEVTAGFPRTLSHVIGQILEDTRSQGLRRIRAVPVHQHGSSWIVQIDVVVLEIEGAGRATLQLRRGAASIAELALIRESMHFDDVEFEVDMVDNASRVTEVYDPQSHPNRPSALPASAVSIERAFHDAGFNVRMSGERSVIPVQDAGADVIWNDMELHNAMQTYWSRFSNRAQWGMWVIYAALHERGTGLGGIMFDTLGQQHRQGTAIFTNSFISEAPPEEMHPEPWRRRMQIWTAIHEIGHGFNLAHSWQKEAGIPFPLTAQNDHEARSFMNYPYYVQGGQSAFFSDFEFRFSEKELLFMRHAPRDFVRMGGAMWGQDHGLRQEPEKPGHAFRLELRPNRETNMFHFLEPVHLELKLTNTSPVVQEVPFDVLDEGHHVSIAVAREGAELTRRHRPFRSACYKSQPKSVTPGQSLYATHFVSASVGGWLIDEPGFYAVQAAACFGGETYISNILRIYVSPDASPEAHRMASEFFDEGVGRVLSFQGAPALEKANDVLREVVDRLPETRVAQHALLGLAGPQVQTFKQLKGDENSARLRIVATEADLSCAEELQANLVDKHAETSAETLGHIQYRSSVERLAGTFAEHGDLDSAISVQEGLVDVLKRRDVLDRVVQDSQSTLWVYETLKKGGSENAGRKRVNKRKTKIRGH